jgi:hypothetical protein
VDMIINGEEIDLSGPPVNPTIRHLWDLKNTGYIHHARACTAYSQWMANYDEIQIAAFFNVSIEEIRADLSHIKTMLPEKAVQLHIREREEIRESLDRSRKVREEIAVDLSLPVDVLLERGINPAQVLKRYRATVSGDFGEIETLRAKDAGPLIDEKAEEHALKDDLQHISRLRNEEKKQTKRNRPTSKETARISAIDNGKCKPDGKRRKQRRLSIRIEAVTLEKLQKHIENSGLNISKIIRDVIDRFLESSTEAESGIM